MHVDGRVRMRRASWALRLPVGRAKSVGSGRCEKNRRRASHSRRRLSSDSGPRSAAGGLSRVTYDPNGTRGNLLSACATPRTHATHAPTHARQRRAFGDGGGPGAWTRDGPGAALLVAIVICSSLLEQHLRRLEGLWAQAGEGEARRPALRRLSREVHKSSAMADDTGDGASSVSTTTTAATNGGFINKGKGSA